MRRREEKEEEGEEEGGEKSEGKEGVGEEVRVGERDISSISPHISMDQ